MRRLVALVGGLPQESAFARYYGQKEERQRTTSDGKTIIKSGSEFAGWMNQNAKGKNTGR